MQVFNKNTNRYVKLKTAISNGLYDNPNNFVIPNDYVIRKDTNRIITLKAAKQLINKKTLLPDNVISSNKLFLPSKNQFVKVDRINIIEEKKRQHEYINQVYTNLRDEKEFEVKLGSMPITDLEFIKTLSKYDGRYTITIGNKTITLNEKNRIKLEEIIKNNLMYVDVSDSFGMITVAIMKEDSIILKPVRKYEKESFIDTDDENEPKIKRKREGAFFKHINLTNIDLTRYQIYNDINKDHYIDNCLIYALRMGGLDDEKLNSIKYHVKNRSIPKCDIEKLCDIIKCKIIIKTDDTKNKEREIYGKEYEETYFIGLLDGHYFIIEDVNITSYALENYFDLKDINEFNYIYRKNIDVYRRDKKRIIDSYDAIKILLNNKGKLIREMTMDDIMTIGETPFYDQVNKNIINLQYNEDMCIHPVEDKNFEDKIKFKNVFFDFETYTDENNKHIPYLCRTYDGKSSLEFFGEECGLLMLESLKGHTRLIAHNATYDFNFLIRYIQVNNHISRGTHLISASGKFKNIILQIKDSYNLISRPLRDFKNVFNLDIEKEVMPYHIYNNREDREKRYLKVDYVKDQLKPKQKDQFIKNIDKWNLRRDDDTFDIIQYSNLYCEIDCKVLHDGYNIFRKWILESFKLDIDNILTSASLAHKYFIQQGCYYGVNEISGVPQRFIQGCVVGGRTMVSENQKIRIKKNINDFDAVSLYPSAMNRMKGFLKGKPKVIENLNYNWLSNQDGYFVDIKINKIGIKRKFPLMSEVNDEGIRIFKNDMEGHIIRVDKISLEDLIQFHKIEFEIIRGYYFNEGFNDAINKTIKFLFEERVRYKKEKNNIQEVFKLIMNSGYGKTIMKEVETDTVFKHTKKDYDTYIERNYNCIKTSLEINSKNFIIEKYKNIAKHKNICHVGVSVLSMSKRIMNEVMCLAEDNDLNIYYQDTDSMHIDDDDIKILTSKFKEKYNRDLIGEDMGQFHSDFEFFDDDGNKRKDIKNIKAVESIFLGKKCYIDKLQGINGKGEIEFDYHVRMKGIPNDVIYNTCEYEGYNDLIEMYNDLFDGVSIVFDLCMNNKDISDRRVNFEQCKDFIVNTKSIFTRELKF
jgi:hypothetical protein